MRGSSWHCIRGTIADGNPVILMQTIVMSVAQQTRKSRRTFVNLRSFCQSAMLLLWKGLRIVEKRSGYTKGGEQNLVKHMHPERYQKNIPPNRTMHGASTCPDLGSRVDSLPKFYWGRTAIKLSTSHRPPRLHVCSKCAHILPQQPLRQLLRSCKNSPYIRPPMRFRQRLAYNASIVQRGRWTTLLESTPKGRHRSQPCHWPKQWVRHPHEKPG